MSTVIDPASPSPAVFPPLPPATPIPAGYRHHARRLVPEPLLVTPAVVLKWYALYPDAHPSSIAETASARAAVAAALAAPGAEPGLGLGFAVHHASTELEYILTGIWYQTQELWLTVDVRPRGSDAPFSRKRPGVDWSTACVWELAPIWREHDAWSRFLYSARDEAAQYAYLADQTGGLI